MDIQDRPAGQFVHPAESCGQAAASLLNIAQAVHQHKVGGVHSDVDDAHPAPCQLLVDQFAVLVQDLGKE